MSHVTELASSRITATDTITVELIEADETPAVVIIRWLTVTAVPVSKV